METGSERVSEAVLFVERVALESMEEVKRRTIG